MANYSYCLKAIITDVTGSLLVTRFSPEADSLLLPVTEVLTYIPNQNPYKLTPIIRDLQNTKHRFVLHFGKGSRKRFPRFVLDCASNLAPPMVPPVIAPQILLQLPPVPVTSLFSLL